MLSTRITLYNSLVSPLFSYADFVWGDKNNVGLMNQLQILQNKAAKAVLDVPIHCTFFNHRGLGQIGLENIG